MYGVAKKEKVKFMADATYGALLKRYPIGEFVIMAEVSDKAGFGRSNSADYIVVGLWPSRGLPVIGIELKSFRGDWLKEIKNPAKAENIYQYCDNFYLLTTDESIAKIEEIPITWGWLSIKGEKIKVIKEAPLLTPKGLSKSFVACMLKRASDKSSYVHKNSIQDKINEAQQLGTDLANRDRDNENHKLAQMAKDVKEFEDTAGIKFASWSMSAKLLGQTYKFIESQGVKGIENNLKRFKDGAEKIIQIIESVLPTPEIPEKVIE